IERQMAEAALAVIEQLRTTTAPPAPLVTLPVLTLPTRLEHLASVGFHATASGHTGFHAVTHATASSAASTAASAATSATAAAALNTTWSVAVRRGAALASLTWQDGVRPTPAALLDAVYAPRRNAEDATALLSPPRPLTGLAAQLPYLCSYALPRRLADAHHRSGEYANADTLYRAAAQFGSLNRELEGVPLWACIASNI